MNPSIQSLAKDFFGFGDNPGRIFIILPSVPQDRKMSREYSNYPLYKFAIPPDDFLSAIEVYTLLQSFYATNGSRDIIEFDFHTEKKSLPKGNRVLIGSPATNLFSKQAVNYCQFRFDPDRTKRIIHGPDNKIYEIGEALNEDGQSIITEDYCLLSKRRTGQHVEFLIAGLRAYGQQGVLLPLRDVGFFKKLQPIIKEDHFQILVKIIVETQEGQPYGLCSEYSIEDYYPTLTSPPGKIPRVFISYARENKSEILKIKKALKNQKIDVWMDERLPPASDWKKKIESEIHQADFFLACFSKEFEDKASSYMNLELDMAALKNKMRHQTDGWIIPLRINQCNIPELDIGKGKNLTHLQRIDLFENPNKAISDIASLIKKE
jgi:hypothetical protein